MSECIGIIVDGNGDFSSLRKRFVGGYKILKTDGPRGHNAKIIDIAHRSRKQIGILSAYKCKKAIVVLDFETRNMSYSNFIFDLERAFSNIVFCIPVSVVVPYRMIENWYLADITFLSQEKVFIKDNLRQKNYEGKHGKNELKRCIKNGISYSETEHGPQLFEILRFNIARSNSPSFDNFLSLLDL